MRTGLLASVLVAAALLLQGAAAAATRAPAADLRVTFWPEGRDGGVSQAWTLRCGPAAGTHPARARACRALARLEQPLRPVRSDLACTQIYGGPDDALVTGTVGGSRVWARFDLGDGCQIARWLRHVPLLPRPGT